jgi:hypothetical protein
MALRPGHAPHSASLNLTSSYTLEPGSNHGVVWLSNRADQRDQRWLSVLAADQRAGSAAGSTTGVPGTRQQHSCDPAQPVVAPRAVFDNAANTTLYFNGVAVTGANRGQYPTTDTQSLVFGQTAYGERWRGLHRRGAHLQSRSHTEIRRI